jgi:hypothetical protein
MVEDPPLEVTALEEDLDIEDLIHSSPRLRQLVVVLVK